MSTPFFLTVGEVSSILRLDEKTIYKWAKTFPGYIKIGGSVRFDREIFLTSLKERAVKPAKRKALPGLMDRHGLTS